MTKVEFVWPGDEYDPQKHLRADQLRALGLQLPSNIPDCAWVPKIATQTSDVECERTHDPDRYRLGVTFVFTQPFEWQRMVVEIDATPAEIIGAVNEAREE